MMMNHDTKFCYKGSSDSDDLITTQLPTDTMMNDSKIIPRLTLEWGWGLLINYGTGSLVKTANDNRLATGTADGHSKLVLIVLSAVVKVLEAATITPIRYDALVTASSQDGILGECQSVGWGRVGADLALSNMKKNITANDHSHISLNLDALRSCSGGLFLLLFLACIRCILMYICPLLCFTWS